VRAWIYLLLGILALAGASSCRRDEKPKPPATTAERDKPLPNIIVLTVDTLRADHLAMYGYSRYTMPSIETFARNAIVFDQAVVPRGSTRPSYASMLTGLYPFRHGVRSNRMQMHADLVTLPEILKEHGYHTAAFVSNFVLTRELSGCDQGFDVYDDRLDEREAYRTNYERTAANTLRAILEWLATDPPQPFFLMVNFIDPHGPYRPPKKFREMYRSEEKRPLDPEVVPAYQRSQGEGVDFFDFVNRYDGEIQYTDEALGLLIEEFKRRGLWDDAFVWFTADHGESMGDHGLFFEHHYHVWDETTRVPMVVRLPGGSDGAGRVKPLASPMDIAPTILSYLGLDADSKMDGVNLLPALKGGGSGDRLVFVEFPSQATPTREPLPDVFAVRSATYKLVRGVDHKTGAIQGQAFYDIASDPNEQHPLRPNLDDPEHARLIAALDRMAAEASTFELPFVVTEFEVPMRDRPKFVQQRAKSSGKRTRQLTDDQIKKLRSLGYID
jgi:arylsulfatase A-like enzyme